MRPIDADALYQAIDSKKEKNSYRYAMDMNSTITRRELLEFIKDFPEFYDSTAQHWIPCTERLPEDLQEINITYINTNPEPYCDFVKGYPFTGSAVFYKGMWYWYTPTCSDLLAEYGIVPDLELDKAMQVVAWMPLPLPYQEKAVEDRQIGRRRLKMECPAEEIVYGYICERRQKPHVFFGTYEEAVHWAKIDQPADRPYYIVKITKHYKICGKVK